MTQITDYKSSGVDVEAGDRLVDWIKTQKLSGQKQNILGGVGGFAALFKLDLTKYKKPVLVSCTDGVGTKVKLAVELNAVEGTGIDLVAMCVNDLITCGADPLFFLDYYASGKLELVQAKALLKGVLEGLRQSDCTLIGGETAEMPGVYSAGDYDCAGFCVGVVDETQVIDGSDVKAGDVALGFGSSGFHSNGYSLIRKLFSNDAAEYRDALMTPTRIYVRLVKELRDKIKVKAMAHITGGGITGNAVRMLPHGVSLKLRKWPWPDLFLEAQRRSGLTPLQMLETFNCGIGFVVFVSPKDAPLVQAVAQSHQLGCWDLGSVVERPGEAEVLL